VLSSLHITSHHLSPQIMSTTQGIVHSRRIDDAKLSREMASSILQQHRGFGVGPETTFHQNRLGKTAGEGPWLCSPHLLLRLHAVLPRYQTKVQIE
jgi:hypothetical protein